jgi:Immunity protein 8
MHAELKRLHSPDVRDLRKYQPKDAACFGILVQAMFGPSGTEGEESFDVVVCTPDWLKEELSREVLVVGRHHIVVARYDYEMIEAFLKTHAQSCQGATWRDVAERLARLGKWEFEDYRPA